MIICVIGGSAGGKSSIAEDIACRLGKNKKKYYIATMKVGDDEENIIRVKKHREQRKGKGFETIERPTDIDKAAKDIISPSIVLLECMSNLCANEMFKDEGVVTRDKAFKRIIEEVKELSGQTDDLIIVSNNVFEDGAEYDHYTVEYLKLLGDVNSFLCETADEVYEAIVGISVRIK